MPIIVMSDLLLNQLKRDSLHIASTFDALCDDDLKQISALLAEGCAFIFVALQDKERKNRDLQLWSCEILTNVANSLSAAVYVLRAGYRLVPGVVLRNAVEAMACCLHGLQKPKDLARIKSGEFDSPKAITTAKKVIPPFGELYGFLSESFVHMGPLHHSAQPILPYETRDDDLLVNLSVIRAAVWLLYVITEFAFLDLVKNPRYWRLEPPNKAVYDPSETEKKWQERFLRGPDAA